MTTHLEIPGSTSSHLIYILLATTVACMLLEELGGSSDDLERSSEKAGRGLWLRKWDEVVGMPRYEKRGLGVEWADRKNAIAWSCTGAGVGYGVTVIWNSISGL